MFTPSLSLTASNIACERGEKRLFHGLSFTVAPSSVLKLAGDNGAGKTSLLRILAGLLPAANGEILWGNQVITQHSTDYCAALHYIGHGSGLKRSLTVYENLCLAKSLTRCEEDTLYDAAHRLHLDKLLQNPLEQLSAGQLRRVALARLLLSPKPLWLLDEPLTAMDQEGIAVVEQLLTTHAQQGGISVVSTHQALLLPTITVTTLRLGL